MKQSHSTRQISNQRFLSQQNLAFNRLISEIDLPEEEADPNPTPPLLMHPPQGSNNPTDSLSLLINKAQKAVKKGSLKIERAQAAKRLIVPTQDKEQDLAFLTGVQIHEPQPKQQETNEQSEALDEQILSLLRRKTFEDDLQQLRRQIKITDGQLRSYERQVKGTEKSVYSLAGRYNSYFNLKVPVHTPTVDFSGLSYFELKNFKKCLRKEQSKEQ